MPELTLEVTVLSPQQQLFKGSVDAISSINDAGPFDILPQHSHFITTIKDKLVLHTPQKDHTFKLTKGVIRCVNDQVEIYILAENLVPASQPSSAPPQNSQSPQ